jgi:hypothetical protein
MTTIRSLADLDDALIGVRYLSVEVWNDVGRHFSCREANALVALFSALDLGAHAIALEDAHAEGDVEGDEHYRPGYTAERVQ